MKIVLIILLLLFVLLSYLKKHTIETWVTCPSGKIKKRNIFLSYLLIYSLVIYQVVNLMTEQVRL